MNTSSSLVIFARLTPFVMGAVACDGGGNGETPGSIVGTWASESIQVLEMSTDCPGEIVITEDIAVSCATETWTFEDDGTLVEIVTTDDTGAPYDWRTEGTWSTSEDLLTVNHLREGPDSENMQPIDPPDPFIAMWSVSGDTLTMGFTSAVASITATFERTQSLPVEGAARANAAR